MGNSSCNISGLTVSQFKQLREVVSYEAQNTGYVTGSFRPTKRYLLDKKGNFPSGLLLRVQRWLKDPTKVIGGYSIADTRIRPTAALGMFNMNLKGVTPRPYQKAAVEALASVARGGAEMVTASGKSITMALLIHRLQLRTLVVVPNLGLKQQLEATFLSLFGTLAHITVENIDSSVLKMAADHDVLIIDECHHAAARTYRKLNSSSWKGIYHRYYFSGTFFRSQEAESILLESITGPVTFTFLYKDAVAMGAVTPVEAYYYDLPKQECGANHYATVYSQLIVNNDYRNNLISDLMRTLTKACIPTLCLVKEIKHGETLSELTLAPFANGQDGDVRMRILEFNLGEGMALIGTTSVLGEGVDTRAAEWVILAAGGKSKNQFCQNVGRGLRLSPGKETCKVILFRDSSHRFMVKHFNAQVKYLKEVYGVVPVKLSLLGGL